MNKHIWIKYDTPKVNSVCSKINTDLILQLLFTEVATLKARFTFSFQLHLVTGRIKLKTKHDLEKYLYSNCNMTVTFPQQKKTLFCWFSLTHECKEADISRTDSVSVYII